MITAGLSRLLANLLFPFQMLDMVLNPGSWQTFLQLLPYWCLIGVLRPPLRFQMGSTCPPTTIHYPSLCQGSRTIPTALSLILPSPLFSPCPCLIFASEPYCTSLCWVLTLMSGFLFPVKAAQSSCVTDTGSSGRNSHENISSSTEAILGALSERDYVSSSIVLPQKP